MGKEGHSKKDLEKIQKSLQQIKMDLVKIAQKGEKELKKVSRKGLLQIDSATLNFKKEHLYFLIGKEYAALKNPPMLTSKLQDLFKELNQLNLDHKEISRKIKVVDE